MKVMATEEGNVGLRIEQIFFLPENKVSEKWDNGLLSKKHEGTYVILFYILQTEDITTAFDWKVTAN